MVSRVHERALRALLSDYDSIFDDIVRRSEEVLIHETYAKAYAGSIEVYDLSAPLIWHRTMKDPVDIQKGHLPPPHRIHKHVNKLLRLS